MKEVERRFGEKLGSWKGGFGWFFGEFSKV